MCIRDRLVDILDTPVSPELLPSAADGTIAQQTEKLVGPYELYDFYLYYVLRFGFGPAKIYHLALAAFAGRYEPCLLYTSQGGYIDVFGHALISLAARMDTPMALSLANLPGTK